MYIDCKPYPPLPPPAKVYVIVYSVSIFHLPIIAGISVKLFIVHKIKNKRFTKTAGFFIAPPPTQQDNYCIHQSTLIASSKTDRYSYLQN